MAKQLGGDVRFPVLSDSQVAWDVGKGRSSFAGLNRLLRASLGKNWLWCLFWKSYNVRSAYSGAYGPTRRFPLRKPSIALPSWWNEAYVGEFKALGDMLCDFGLHSHQLDSVPDLSALAQFELAWIPKSGGSRRQKHNQKFNRNSLQEQLIKCLLLSLIVHLAMILKSIARPLAPRGR